MRNINFIGQFLLSKKRTIIKILHPYRHSRSFCLQLYIHIISSPTSSSPTQMHTLACTAPQKVSCQIKLTSCLSWITTLQAVVFTETPATHPYHSHTTMLVINTHPQIYPDSFSLEAEFSFASSYQLVTALSYG